MRTIKFRAWDKDKKFMVDDGFTLTYDGICQGLGGVVKNYKLLQFTGLKDKRGREIYEGDIVNLYDSHPAEGILYFTGVMTFVEDDLWWIVKNGTAWRRPVRKLKVIGSIYENPELLKGGENE